MKNPFRRIVVMTIASLVLIAANVPSDAANGGVKR